ncbi:MAG: Omp28-related outer membrane protein, partial [Chitinophagales bacterium]
MKRFLLLALVVTGLSQATKAQYQRMVLLEEFTQASCGPCASQNPGFNAILQANEDKAIILKFQVWWPGFDPMYLQNQPDVDARVSYYGVTGVPHATMDGVNVVNDCGYYEGAPACVSGAEITTEYGVTSPFEINVTHSFSPDYSTINIHVDVTAGSDMTGSLKLRCAVAEKNINFDTPPGTNGETEFLGVMKKMLPDASGTSTGDFYGGETKSYDFSWDLANIYDMNQIEVVAWMQNDGTKGIMQAAVSDPIGGLPAIDYASTDVSSIFCTNSFDPVVSVANNSDDALTAIDLSYSVDGGAASVYNWTGSIAAHTTGNINLPTVTVATGGTHTLGVTLMPVGGTVDINMVNNSIASNISVLDATQVSVEEGFQGADYPPANWAVDNLSTGDGWVKGTGNVGGYGESTISSKANFYYI